MKTARVINGAIVAYPYPLRPTAKQAHPEVSPLPGTWEQCTPEQLTALECVDVQAVARPELQIGEGISEGAPEFVGGQWRQTWVVTAAPTPTLEDEQRRLALLIQDHLDAEAQTRGFDGVFMACTYLGDPNPQFAADAAQLRAWRSAVWTAAYAIQAEVLAGNRAPPTDAELLAELPPVTEFESP